MSGKSFVDRIEHERMGIVLASNVACQTCLFAHGEVDWDGTILKLSPQKSFCLIYEPDDSNGKPEDVAFEGAECEYYEKE